MGRSVPLLLVLLVLSTSAYGDMGAIPLIPNVQVFEPNQRALIAWDGEEEILLLSTDLSASKPTKILEILPVPNEPTVKKGDLKAFQTAVQIINEHLARKAIGSIVGKGPEMLSLVAAESPKPAGEVTFHDRIGAHEVSVTHVLDATGFMDWAKDYLKRSGAKNPTIPPIIEESVRQYLKEGYKWFIYDVVDIGPTVTTKDALQFRFKTKRFYYPLRISRAATGTTKIELTVLSRHLFSNSYGLPRKHIQLMHDPIELNKEETTRISKEMFELLPGYPMLRIWSIEGDLKDFDADLLLD